MVSKSDVRRLFLQAVLSRRVIPEKLAKTIWTKCIEAVKAADESLDVPSGPGDWATFLEDVNHSLNGLDFEFKLVQDESAGNLVYILVNMKSDEIAQLATEYSPAEIVFFKTIVEKIMMAPNESYCVTSLGALRHVSGMSKSQAEVVLGSLVARNWLLRNPKGLYTLSTRSLLELQSYLKSTYPDDVLECTICMEASMIMTRGIACHTDNCKTRMHYHCFDKYKRRNRACPSCSKPWPEQRNDLIQVGERAFKPGQEARMQPRKSQAEEDGEEDDEDGDVLTQTQTQTQMQTQTQTQQTQTQKQSRTRSRTQSSQLNQTQMDSDDEEEPAPRKGRSKSRR